MKTISDSSCFRGGEQSAIMEKIFFPFCLAFPKLYFLSVFIMHQENGSSAKTVLSSICVTLISKQYFKSDEQTVMKAKWKGHRKQFVPLTEITFYVFEDCYCFTS